MRLRMSGMLCIILLLVLAPSVSARVSINAPPNKWASPSGIQFWIDTTVHDGYCSDFATALRQAFANWSNVTASQIYFTEVSSPPQTGIVCRFSTSDRSWEGVFNPETSDGQYFRTATLWLNRYKMPPNCYNSRLSVAAHEVGHALGLADIKPGTEQFPVIMLSTTARWTTYGLTGPTPQEIRAVNDHYSSSGSGGGDGGGEPPVGPIITGEDEKIK